MRSVPVVELHVLTNQAQQMPFTEHDHLVNKLTSKCPGEPFDVTILPR